MSLLSQLRAQGIRLFLFIDWVFDYKDSLYYRRPPKYQGWQTEIPNGGIVWKSREVEGHDSLWNFTNKVLKSHITATKNKVIWPTTWGILILLDIFLTFPLPNVKSNFYEKVGNKISRETSTYIDLDYMVFLRLYNVLELTNVRELGQGNCRQFFNH